MITDVRLRKPTMVCLTICGNIFYLCQTYGGLIILGVKELDNKHWKTTGLKVADKEKLLDNLWYLLHNPNKVNINLLSNLMLRPMKLMRI